MKALLMFKRVVFIVGLIMLVGGVLAYQSTRTFLDGAVSAPGTVVDFEASRGKSSTTYSAVVEFVDEDGQTHRVVSSYSSKPAAYELHESVEVLYPPSQPQDGRIKRFFELWSGAAIMLGGAGLIFGLWAILWQVGRSRNRQRDELKSSGMRVTAEIQSVDYDQSLSINGRHPFVIVCQWLNPETRLLHVFQSQRIWFDPTSMISGSSIDVYLSPTNPKKYYVDISFLPQRAS